MKREKIEFLNEKLGGGMEVDYLDNQAEILDSKGKTLLTANEDGTFTCCKTIYTFQEVLNAFGLIYMI